MKQIKKVLIITLLKPADEPRMFERFGKTLQEAGYEVHLAGQQLSDFEKNRQAGIIFHPIFKFTRLNIKRIFAPIKALSLAFHLRPMLVIISTPELLKVFSFYKFFFKTKLYYDIQENYFLNTLKGKWVSAIIRHFLAGIIRMMEWVHLPFLKGIFLAEKSYQSELPFLKYKKWILLENKTALTESDKDKIKLIKFPKKKNYGEPLKFLFTGSIDEDTGIFTTIDFVKRIHGIYPKVFLKIMGKINRNIMFKKLKKSFTGHPYITLIADSNFISHNKIISSVLESDFGVIVYDFSPHIQNKTPTKLYEYLSYGLPVIINQNPKWETMVAKYNAGFSVNFQEDEINSIKNKLFMEYFSIGPVQESLWETEKNKLINFLG